MITFNDQYSFYINNQDLILSNHLKNIIDYIDHGLWIHVDSWAGWGVSQDPSTDSDTIQQPLTWFE